MLFQVGKVTWTKDVLQSEVSSTDLVNAFGRYINGDWGEVLSLRDALKNDVAIATGDAIVAVYKAKSGLPFAIATAENVTTVMLGDEVDRHTELLNSAVGRA